MIDQEAFELLKVGNRDALGWIYRTYRNQFVWWAVKNYKISTDDALTLYEDALIILSKNAETGKMVTLSSSLKTYLIGVAINIKKEENRKSHKEMEDLKKYVTELETTENPFLSTDNEEVIQLVLTLLKKMGEPCKEILTRFYLNEESLEQVQKGMNFASTAVVKVQKARCLKDLMGQILKVKQSIHNGMDGICGTFLKHYYLEKKSLEDIRILMHFDTIEDVNKQKENCLKNLLDKLQ